MACVQVSVEFAQELFIKGKVFGTALFIDLEVFNMLFKTLDWVYHVKSETVEENMYVNSVHVLFYCFTS